MKPTRAIYPNYEPLTPQETAELIRLVRKATGAGQGCGVLFKRICPNDEPQAFHWQDSFMRFGSLLQRVHQHRAAQIGMNNPACVREVEWGAFRSAQELEWEKQVAAEIERGE